MRFTTGAIVAGSLILIIALAVYLRVQPPAEISPPSPSGQAAGGGKRGLRVEDRLSRLRADYEERRQAPDRLEASRVELPTPGSVSNSSAADVDEWRSIVLNDPDPDERAGAILMLSGEDDPETLDVLTQAMNDRDAEVRLAAVEGLGDFAEELNPALLLPALDDPDPEVRFEAVGILGDMEDEEALKLVFDSLDDPDEDVRSLAEGIIEIAEPVPRRPSMREVMEGKLPGARRKTR